MEYSHGADGFDLEQNLLDDFGFGDSDIEHHFWRCLELRHRHDRLDSSFLMDFCLFGNDVRFAAFKGLGVLENQRRQFFQVTAWDDGCDTEKKTIIFFVKLKYIILSRKNL